MTPEAMTGTDQLHHKRAAEADLKAMACHMNGVLLTAHRPLTAIYHITGMGRGKRPMSERAATFPAHRSTTRHSLHNLQCSRLFRVSNTGTMATEEIASKPSPLSDSIHLIQVCQLRQAPSNTTLAAMVNGNPHHSRNYRRSHRSLRDAEMSRSDLLRGALRMGTIKDMLEAQVRPERSWTSSAAVAEIGNWEHRSSQPLDISVTGNAYLVVTPLTELPWHNRSL